MTNYEPFFDYDMDSEEFRRLGHRVIEMIASYYSTIRDLPVTPDCSNTAMVELFREQLPKEGQDPDTLLHEWTSKVLPYLTHLGSPRFFGFVMGSGTMMGTLAETLAASVNVNAGGWKAAPAATAIEQRTISWLAELLDYPIACGGLFTSGGTMANFTAITTALRDKANGVREQGIPNNRLTIYMSDHEGHISIYRVAQMMNLGSEAIRLVKSREDFTMDTEDLEQQLEKDENLGYRPFCVVAQVGSINVGAIDPLEDIAMICRKRKLWFHADGACGAMGAILPGKKAQYKGLDMADSVTLDPHKWLYIPYECGGLLVRDPEKLEKAFSMQASYLQEAFPTKKGSAGVDFYENGPQMSRSFRALKVWMSLKHYGKAGYQRMLSQNVRCAEYLDGLVRNSKDFKALHQPNLFLYCFQYAPINLQRDWEDSPEELQNHLDGLNQKMADTIRSSGEAFIMTTRIHNRVVIRLSICSHRTTYEDIDAVFNTLQDTGNGLMALKD